MKNNYEVRGGVVAIFIARNGESFETIIDADDLERVKKFRNTFFLSNESYVEGSFQENKKRTYVSLHRIVMGNPIGYEVDHINHNTLDNRKSNLRVVTRQENVCNASGARGHNVTSGHLGVSWNRRIQKWVVQVRVKGVVCFRKLFDYDNLDEAKITADQARAYYMPTSKDARDMDVLELERFITQPDAPRKSNMTSGVRNVCWNKEQRKWDVSFAVNRVRMHFGRFKNLSDAIEKANEVRESLKKKSS